MITENNNPKYLPIVMLVRDFGLIGGMENYVWNITKHLISNDIKIIIICKNRHRDLNSSNLTIFESKSKTCKPRWLEAILFSRFCDKTIAKIKEEYGNIVTISHERHWDQDYAVFHGPPYALSRKNNLIKKLSFRHFINMWFESKFILKGCRKGVIPVSVLISDILSNLYRDQNIHLLAPINPGIDLPYIQEEKNKPSKDKKIIAFIGREWKRKGLPMSIKILSKLKLKRNDWEYWIIGCEGVDTLITDDIKGNCKVIGLTNQVDKYYPSIDLLLHPAKMEPFGMVISESLSYGIPVVISEQCGACDIVTSENGSVLRLDDCPGTWADRIDFWLTKGHVTKYTSWTWAKVALKFAELAKIR